MWPVKPRNGSGLCLVALLLGLAAPASWALSGDREQPIHIEADKATLDEGQGVGIYEGNVLLRQGTLRLRGNRMTVYLEKNRLVRLVLEGSPASYAQRPDEEELDQQAEAGRIEYQAVSQRLILQDNARIWREQSEQFSSDRIVVDLKDNTLDAGSDGPGGRVHIILQPKTLQAGEPAGEQ